ncbi:unnamed protein product [Tilletia caries]|nr:unnamed protein product [Tilletia caries]
MAPSSRKTRHPRLKSFASKHAKCIDGESRRRITASRSNQSYTLRVGGTLPEVRHRPALLPANALADIATRIRKSRPLRDNGPSTLKESADAMAHEDAEDFDNYEFSTGDMSFLSHDHAEGSDVGSDIEEEEDTQDLLQAMILCPVPRKTLASPSRFASWHAKVPHIFELAYGSIPHSPPTLSMDCPCAPSPHRRYVCIKVYDVGRPSLLQGECCHRHLVEMLIRADLFPASPSRPQVAFTMTLLRWHQILVDQAGLGANNMAQIIQSFLRRGTSFQRSRTPYSVPDTLRKQLKSALTWLTVTERYADHLATYVRPTWRPERPRLCHDDLVLTIDDLADSCPACFNTFKAGAPILDGDSPQVMISIDGNFTQKRKGRPDTGTDPDQENCIAKIRAIDSEGALGSSSLFDINGLMAIVKAAGPNLRHLGVLYDIGCRFAPSTRVAAVFSSRVKITWAVPIFHVYGHTYSCQVRFNPRNLPGFGWTDGEGMERVWSGLANLIGSTRNMSLGERRFALEERCHFITSERRLNLFHLLELKEGRLKAIQQKALSLFTDGLDHEGIPPQYRPGAELAPLDGDDAAARPDVGDEDEDDSDWQIPLQLRRIDPQMIRIVRRMSIGRRRAIEKSARDDRQRKKHPTLKAVALYSQDLLRILGEIQLLQGLMYDRPAAVRKGYKTTIRLSLSLKAEKDNARKKMKKVNDALIAEHPDDSDQPPFQHRWDQLFDDNIYQFVEQCAKEADPSLESLPWWAKTSTAKLINAFEELGRIREEFQRLQHERASAHDWLKARIVKLAQVKDEHAVYRDALSDALNLQRHWNDEEDCSTVLLPYGAPVTCITVDHEIEDDQDDPDDPELQAHLNALALDALVP